MIKLVKKVPQTKKTEPYYTLTYEYMIGDDDGNTTKEVILSKDNPYIERYCTLLEKLEPVKGTWGLILDRETLGKCLKEGQINDEEYNFLLRLAFGRKKSTFVVEEENEDYADEFEEGVSGETEYSFLVFEGLNLTYTDEWGETHQTIIVPDEVTQNDN